MLEATGLFFVKSLSITARSISVSAPFSIHYSLSLSLYSLSFFHCLHRLSFAALFWRLRCHYHCSECRCHCDCHCHCHCRPGHRALFSWASICTQVCWVHGILVTDLFTDSIPVLSLSPALLIFLSRTIYHLHVACGYTLLPLTPTLERWHLVVLSATSTARPIDRHGGCETLIANFFYPPPLHTPPT